MNNEMVRRACHAIGMDNKSPFYKFGKKHFISYRNYSVSNRLGDEYFDKMESEGLAESDRGKQSVTYYLTEKGFQWLEKECSMVIHVKNRPEKKYYLNKDDEEQIIEIRAWLKKKKSILLNSRKNWMLPFGWILMQWNRSSSILGTMRTRFLQEFTRTQFWYCFQMSLISK